MLLSLSVSYASKPLIKLIKSSVSVSVGLVLLGNKCFLRIDLLDIIKLFIPVLPVFIVHKFLELGDLLLSFSAASHCNAPKLPFEFSLYFLRRKKR